MSCFCFQEMLDAPPTKLKEVLAVPLKVLQETARHIATVEVECRISDVDVEVYVKKFKPDMMDVAFAWANVSWIGPSLHCVPSLCSVLLLLEALELLTSTSGFSLSSLNEFH